MFRRGACVALFLTLIVAAAASAPAADDVLKIIPSDALAWALVHRVADTDAKILKIGEALGVPPVSPLGQIKNITAAKEGLDEQGIAGVIVMPSAAAKGKPSATAKEAPKSKPAAKSEPAAKAKKAESPPSLVYIIPVTDYKKFLANFHPDNAANGMAKVQVSGADYLMANRDKYALVVTPADRKALDAVLGAKQSAAAEVAGLESWFATNDVDLVATQAGVKVFARRVRQELKEMVKMFDDLGMGDQMATPKAGVQFYISLLDLAEKEVALAAVGLRLDKEGSLRVVKRVRFAKGGQFREALAGVKPIPNALIERLPGGAFVFAVAGGLPETSGKALIGASMELMKQNRGLYGLSAEQVDKLAKVSADTTSSISKMAVVMKPPKRGEPLYSNVFGVFEVDDAATFLKKYEKHLTEANAIAKEAKSALLAATTFKRTEIGGRPALEMQMTIPMPKSAVTIPNQEQLMEKFIGPGLKATTYVATADDKTLVFGFNVPKGKVADLIAAMKDPKSGLGADADVAVTAAMLPHDALGTGYVSPRGCVSFFAQMMAITFAAISPDGAGPQFNLPAFPKTPPVGATVKIVSGELEAELVVPAAVFKAIGEYRNQVTQGIMNQPATP